MVQLRGALRRRLVKFERPKTLFGKLPYSQEQVRIHNAWDDIQKATVIYNPYATGMYLPIFSRLPEKWRKERIAKYLKRAKTKLNEVLP
jgi:ribosomal protein L32E